jgi:hypothetical protein
MAKSINLIWRDFVLKISPEIKFLGVFVENNHEWKCYRPAGVLT